ncbi:putative ubiquitin-conjugating enzyme protein 17 [Diplonema papillatum]|nr:putative ubiquitin-conjugating enzyme protein 17 [Diplonema papillatum]
MDSGMEDGLASGLDQAAAPTELRLAIWAAIVGALLYFFFFRYNSSSSSPRGAGVPRPAGRAPAAAPSADADELRRAALRRVGEGAAVHRLLRVSEDEQRLRRRAEAAEAAARLAIGDDAREDRKQRATDRSARIAQAGTTTETGPTAGSPANPDAGDVKGWFLRYVLRVKCEGETIDHAPASMVMLFRTESDADYTELPGLLELAQGTESGCLGGAVEDDVVLLSDPPRTIAYYANLAHRCTAASQQLASDASIRRQLLDSGYAARVLDSIQRDARTLALPPEFIAHCPAERLQALVLAPPGAEGGAAVEKERVAEILRVLLAPAVDRSAVLSLSEHLRWVCTRSRCGLDEFSARFAGGAAACDTMASGLQFHAQAVLAPYFNEPNGTDVANTLKAIPKYPQVHPSEIDASLGPLQSNAATGISNIAACLREVLKTDQSVVLRWLDKYFELQEPRVGMDTNKAGMQGAPPELGMYLVPSETAVCAMALLTFELAAPACADDGRRVGLENYLQRAESPAWRQLPRLGGAAAGGALPAAGGANFSTKIFFLALRAIRAGIVPCLRVFRHLREGYGRVHAQWVETGGGQGQMDYQQMPSVVKSAALLYDTVRAVLFNPRLTDLLLEVATCCARLLDRADAATRAEFPLPFVHDTLDILKFCAEFLPDKLDVAAATATLNFFVTLSLTTRHQLLKARVTCLLGAFAPAKAGGSGVSYSNVFDAGNFSSFSSPISLSSCVERMPCLHKLPRHLFQVYVGMERAEGYDVTKDEHIFTTAKATALNLFLKLYFNTTFKQGLTEALANPDDEDVVDFVKALTTNAIHLLEHCLLRLTEVNDLEKIRLRQPEVTQKLGFQRMAAKGFLSSAMESLKLVQIMADPRGDLASNSPSPVPSAMKSAEVLRVVAHFAVRFLDKLFGPTADDLKTLPDPAELNYDFFGMLEVVVNVIVLFKDVPEFPLAFATHPDCNRSKLLRAAEEVNRTALGGRRFAEGLRGFIEQLPGGDDRAAGAWEPPAKAVELDEKRFEEVFAEWQCFEADLGAGDQPAYRTHLLHREIAAAGASGGGAGKRRQLMKDRKLLGNLPLHPSAAVFAACDESRMDVFRFVLTGPVGTPYAHGLFVFDVFCQDSYPANPPTWLHRVSGPVRFSPNLYESGKICLSLLNTWHGDDADMKWVPDKSSLYQVALSIQSAVLVPDPYFGEPGTERLRNTPNGDKYSFAYNEDSKLACLRYAILEHVRSPPQGCEELFKLYFSEKSDAILMTATQWMAEASAEAKPKFAQAIGNLADEFAKLQPSTCSIWSD